MTMSGILRIIDECIYFEQSMDNEGGVSALTALKETLEEEKDELE